MVTFGLILMESLSKEHRLVTLVPFMRLRTQANLVMTHH
nr:MAG TPA_asm: hypothetical protein [Bacteriophage sp.]